MSSKSYKIFFLAVMLGIAVFFNHEPKTRRLAPGQTAALEADAVIPGGNTGNIFTNVKAYSGKSAYPPFASLQSDANSRPQEPEAAPITGSQKALVADLIGGENYFSKGESENWPIASLTKLVTAATAHDILDPDRKVTLSAKDFPSNDDTKVHYFRAGETYKVRDLIRGMLAVSANEAAEALANAYGRSAFIAKMNEKARSWGLDSTFFEDPSGLSPQNQSDLSDLEKFSFHIYADYRFILDITRTPKITVTDANTGETKSLNNINAFAGQNSFVGGKTGYTDEAGGNLLSIFSVRKNPILIIVLGSEDRFGDTQKLLDWFTGSRFAARITKS